MKKFHLLSFGLGLGSGLLLLVLVFGAMRIFGGPARGGFPPNGNGGNFQQMRGANGGGPNAAMMAERFGMTEAELQAELDSGKTMQQIAEEKGIEFPARTSPFGTGGPMGGRGMQGGGMSTRSSASGATATGTGNTTVPTSSVSQ